MHSADEIRLRPELLLGPNPLIERAAPFIPLDELPVSLARDPLQGKSWRSIPPESREPLLDYAQQHFVPTELVLEPAAGIQRLFRRGLTLRNPLTDAERARTTRVAVASSKGEIAALPRLDGAGGMWAGPTGIGKSTIARRVLEVICPVQVIEHEPCPRAGWQRLVQCCYLYVDHPSNGSRGALLKRVLHELDKAIGTDLYSQYERVTNIDTLLVTVSKQLTTHRVALLVIDEKQGRNFLESPWQLEFVLFYLSLMNLGISVLLLGNTLAFGHLRSFSQVMRRFSVGGCFDLAPALEKTTPWWQDFVSGMRDFSVVEHCAVSYDELFALEFEACGGLPGLMEAYQSEAQRIALRRGGSSAQLLKQDYLDALNSPRYAESAKIAQALRQAQQPFEDIEETHQLEPDSIAKQLAAHGPIDAALSMVARYKADTTRRTNQLRRKLRSIEGMSEEDLRALGVTDELLEGLQKTTEADAAGKKK